MPAGEVGCEDVEREGLVERFLAGTLPPDKLEQFESHAIFCNRCQRSIELGATVRAALRAPASVPPRTGQAHANRWRSWYVAAGIAATLFVTVLVFKSDGRLSNGLAPLGALSQAPVYLGVPVRADDAQRGEAQFDSAMRAYSAQRYDVAADELRAAIGAGFDNAPANFFLGACLLMTQQPRAAVNALSRVIASGPSPYETEAYFYRAKGWLQLRDRDHAMDDLDRAAEQEGDVGAQSRQLRDSVSGVTLR